MKRLLHFLLRRHVWVPYRAMEIYDPGWQVCRYCDASKPPVQL
jgi:hypothetical protein